MSLRVCSRFLSCGRCSSRWLSIDWNEPLKSTVAMLTTETYIIPKLENRVHLGILVSASFCPLDMGDQGYSVRLAVIWFIRGQWEHKHSWEEKGDDMEITGSLWLIDFVFLIKNFHPLLVSFPIPLVFLLSSTLVDSWLDLDWLIEIRKIILDFLLSGSFLVPLNYYIHWGRS